MTTATLNTLLRWAETAVDVLLPFGQVAICALLLVPVLVHRMYRAAMYPR